MTTSARMSQLLTLLPLSTPLTALSNGSLGALDGAIEQRIVGASNDALSSL